MRTVSAPPSSRSRSGDQSVPVGVDDRLDAVAQAEFGEDARDEGLDGLGADDQGGGDLAVGPAVGDEAQDLQFARGEGKLGGRTAGRPDAGRVSLSAPFNE
jgi:hypothetical protein